MKAIYLHGSLRDKFQDRYDLDIATPAEGLRALMILVPGFGDAIAEGEWCLIKGSLEEGSQQDYNSLDLSFGKTTELHIIPALELSKQGGLAKTLIGIAMIGVMFIPGSQILVLGMKIAQSTVAMIGLGMALSGISQMLTPVPKVGNYNDDTEKTSFLFNTPQNLTAQGNVVPLPYGLDILVGSLVVHSAVAVDDMGSALAGGTGGGSTDDYANDGVIGVTIARAVHQRYG